MQVKIHVKPTVPAKAVPSINIQDTFNKFNQNGIPVFHLNRIKGEDVIFVMPKQALLLCVYFTV